jgi:amino acid transporter
MTDTLDRQSRATPRRRSYRMGRAQLLFLSVGAVIGSGWLLAPFKGAGEAGASVLISWLIGGFAVLLLGFVYAELGSMFPLTGGGAHFPRFAFGGLVGFVSGWLYFVAAVAVPPLEVTIALNYATVYVGNLAHGDPLVLSNSGILVAVLLLFVFTMLNAQGIRLFARVNQMVVAIKIVVPVVTVLAFIYAARNWVNFTAGGGFAPNGWAATLGAVATSGVMFAYLGFEQAVQFGRETRNPGRDIPFAVVGSIALGVLLYVGLQIAVILALAPSLLHNGFAGVSLGSGGAAPFAAVATSLGLGWLAAILYGDAGLSPGGTGLTIAGSATRSLTALAEGRFLPRWFLPHRAGQEVVQEVNWVIALTPFILGLVFLVPDPRWQSLVKLVVQATVMSYALQPLALQALRRQAPRMERPFRLPWPGLLGPVGFLTASEIILFAGWDTYWRLMAAVGLGFVLLLVSTWIAPRGTHKLASRPTLDIGNTLWLWLYLAGVGIIAYFGSFPGGRHQWEPGWDVGIMAAFSLAVYYIAVAQRLPNERALHYIGEIVSPVQPHPEID